MKWGLGQSYDRVQFIPRKLRAYADLTKPASSVGVTVAFFLASIFFYYFNGRGQYVWTHMFQIVYTSATVLFAHGASQTMNMVEDAEMDRNTEHKQNRPIPSGLVSEEEGRALAWIMSGAALIRGFMVSFQFGMFIVLMLFLGIFYNLEPIRAKQRVISIPWQAVSRGLLSFPLVWAAYGDPWKAVPWTLGIFMYFYVMGFQNSADIIDKEVDEKYGVNTFVVMFGVRRTVLISLACTVAMAVVITAGALVGFVPKKLWSMMAILPLCLYMCIEMWYNPHKISESTGNHPAWLWFYGGFVVALLIPLGTVLL